MPTPNVVEPDQTFKILSGFFCINLTVQNFMVIGIFHGDMNRIFKPIECNKIDFKKCYDVSF